ncbi:hypothetical protein GCM10023200_25610 [Actinomycetospora chlora]|uniref:Uncharacterized protein n=1 Tax=Actinomycetospora chlora TaxID=663608 RepID=A0ABP9B491_9PSEU
MVPLRTLPRLDADDAVTERLAVPGRGDPAAPGNRRHSRLVLGALVAVLLLGAAAAVVGTSLASAPPAPTAGPAPSSPLPTVPPSPSSASSAMPAADPGPTLVDTEGVRVTGPVAARIRALYRALRPYDPAAIRRLTDQGHGPDAQIASALADGSTRDAVREVMRTPIRHEDEQLAYLSEADLRLFISPTTGAVVALVLPGSTGGGGTGASSSCGQVPNAITGGTTGVSVVDGSTPCTTARTIVTAYYAAPLSGDVSATLRRDVRGWTCTSTTGAEYQDTGRAGDCVSGTRHVVMG